MGVGLLCHIIEYKKERGGLHNEFEVFECI